MKSVAFYQVYEGTADIGTIQMAVSDPLHLLQG